MNYFRHQIRLWLRRLADFPSDIRYSFERSRYLKKLPENDLPDPLNALSQAGIAVTSLEDLNLEGTISMLEEVKVLLPVIRTLSKNDTCGIALPPYAAVMNPVLLARDHPDIPLWGLQHRLLDLIENYIGVPSICMGASLRRDLVSQDTTGTRRWHVDPNDRRYPKIIVYLDDVTEENGPFQYIPSTFKSQLACFNGRKSVSDEEMASRVKPEHWCSVCGKSGTVIIFDSANVFHRGAVTFSERYSLFFSYSSKRPKRADLCDKAYQLQSMLELGKLPLTDRQRSAMFFK